jgi:hypothetical protein
MRSRCSGDVFRAKWLNTKSLLIADSIVCVVGSGAI